MCEHASVPQWLEMIRATVGETEQRDCIVVFRASVFRIQEPMNFKHHLNIMST